MNPTGKFRFHPLIPLLAVLLFLSPVARGQYVIYKTTDGMVYHSKIPGLYFTLDIAGKAIKPLSPPGSPNAYLNVDGRFLQVVIVSLEGFKGDPAKPDGETLKLYVGYEQNYWKDKAVDFKLDAAKLPSGRTAMAWSFSLSPALREETIKQGGHPGKSNEMLSFHSGKFIISLGSDVEGDDTKEAVDKFLLRIASTFQDSETPFSLKFLPDGHYERQPEKP